MATGEILCKRNGYTHWRRETVFSQRDYLMDYSCATIRISHKQFLAKYFAVVELDLNLSVWMFRRNGWAVVLS